MLKHLSKYLFALAFVLVPFLAVAPAAHASPSWTVTSNTLHINVATGEYSYDYTGYGGTTPLTAIAFRTDEAGTYLDNTDTTVKSCSAGHCAGRITNFNTGQISCSTSNVVIDMYDGNNEYYSYAVASPTYDGCPFTPSTVSINPQARTYSVTWSSYSGSTPTRISFRNNADGTTLDNADTSNVSCSGSTCSGTLNHLYSGTITCNTSSLRVVMYDGSNEYYSSSVSPSFSGGCSGDFTASGLSVNVSTGAYSYTYSAGYSGTLPLVAVALRTDQNGTWLDNTDTSNPYCNGGTRTCSGTIANFNTGHISCGSGDLVIDMYDGSNQKYSAPVTPTYSGCSTTSSVAPSNVSINVSTNAYSFNYDGYAGNVPMNAIAFRTDIPGTTLDNTDTSTRKCSHGTCTGTIANFNTGHISCSDTSVIIDMYDGSGQYYSWAASPSYSCRNVITSPIG
jgi:hypothetical protein